MEVILQEPKAFFAVILCIICQCYTEQHNTTMLSTSLSLSPLNLWTTINATAMTTQVNKTSSTVSVNLTEGVSPNSSTVGIVNASASIISQITGSTKTQNSTFFLEFKSGAIKWNQELTKEHGNTFINTANTIVEIIDNIYVNMSMYKGSYVIGFREGGYVSVKLQFHNADTDNVDQFIEFLRAGGGELLTDRVYIKLGNIADCIVTYVYTSLCDCSFMTYKRMITCRQPDIYGGEPCPEKCTTGHLIAGSQACSWDDLDAFECAASTPTHISTVLVVSIAAIIGLPH
ncbi:uncharacterized protein LOC114967567 isoform X1 [Acropora millepora]|uniref:uncharacterized protein LOC114967567 isoform X1 n=1 Tax=Acropora millepora TaxID=45264 RepID=UPI001CF298FC|nr:uncharacterized protein LOC114967567 isoform X1 [Acropora millepora]XP_029203453.2 uncharacterized protein LOC114967567 isoform X1 [Acropora millepora]